MPLTRRSVPLRHTDLITRTALSHTLANVQICLHLLLLPLPSSLEMLYRLHFDSLNFYPLRVL